MHNNRDRNRRMGLHRCLLRAGLAVAMVLGMIHTAHSQIISADCPMLAQFYRAASRGKWKNSSGWEPSDGNHYDCCLWAGVTCAYPLRYAGLATPWVTQLNLSDNGLQGTISSALMGLKRMNSLDLSKNRLKGDFVPVVFLGGELRCEDVGGTTRDDMYHRSCNRDSECGGGKCTFMGGLKEVYLNANLLTGSIPPEIGRLHKTLEILDLSVNKIEGALPASMGVLLKLKELNAYYNRLSGTIPREFGLMSRMRFLNLAFNHLSGTIPVQLGNMARLEQLDLSMNQFAGNVPGILGVLTYPRRARCDNPLGSCFGTTLGNITLDKGACLDGEMTTWHIQGYKQPCQTGAADARWQCKSCQNPYPSAGRDKTLATPEADCHDYLPPLTALPPVPNVLDSFNSYPWGPPMPNPVVQKGVGPSLRLLVILRCTRTPSLYARPLPPQLLVNLNQSRVDPQLPGDLNQSAQQAYSPPANLNQSA